MINVMSKTITDHDEIRTWIEEGNGQPGKMAETELLAVYFGQPESDIAPIEWDEFFEIFDRNNLAFMYEDRSAGDTTSFFEFIDRATENIEDEEEAEDKSDLDKFVKVEDEEQKEEEGEQTSGSATQ
jgi:hypothetical protein